MLHYENHQYQRDDGPLPELKVRDVFANVAMIVGAGLALCLWNCVLAPGYFLVVYAFEAAAHALSPAQEFLCRIPLREIVSPLARIFVAIAFALAAYVAVRFWGYDDRRVHGPNA